MSSNLTTGTCILIRTRTQDEAASGPLDDQSPLLKEDESIEVEKKITDPEQIILAGHDPLSLGGERDPVDEEYLQVLLDTEFGPPKFPVSACMGRGDGYRYDIKPFSILP